MLEPQWFSDLSKFTQVRRGKARLVPTSSDSSQDSFYSNLTAFLKPLLAHNLPLPLIGALKHGRLVFASVLTISQLQRGNFKSNIQKIYICPTCAWRSPIYQNKTLHSNGFLGYLSGFPTLRPGSTNHMQKAFPDSLFSLQPLLYCSSWPSAF